MRKVRTVLGTGTVKICWNILSVLTCQVKVYIVQRQHICNTNHQTFHSGRTFFKTLASAWIFPYVHGPFFFPNAEKPASNIVLSQEKSEGNETQAGYAKDYRVKVENELQKICDTILKLLDQGLIPKATQAESKVFYQKMKDTRRNDGSFVLK